MKNQILLQLFIICLYAGINTLGSQSKAQQNKSSASMHEEQDKQKDLANKMLSNEQQNGFVKNQGQITDLDGKPLPSVLYLLNEPGLKVQLRKSGFSYDAFVVSSPLKEKVQKSGDRRTKKVEEDIAPKHDTMKWHRIDISFPGANPNPVIEAHDALLESLYIYNGKFTSGLSLSQYKRVVYRDLYPGIDLEFVAGGKGQLPVEYNFIVKPGADASRIRLKYEGSDEIKLNEGNIDIKLAFGSLSESIPASWTGDQDKSVEVAYAQQASGVFGFEVGTYDNTKTLTIDPTPRLVWGTFYQAANTGGQTLTNGNQMMDMDAQGNMYIVFETPANTWQTTAGAFQASKSTGPNSDLYVVKFNSQGLRVAATYYGGLGSDEGYGIDISPSLEVGQDGVYLSFSTNSVGLGTLNIGENGVIPDEGYYYDFMVVKLNFNLGRAWSRYVGGVVVDVENYLEWFGESSPTTICVDKDGNVVLIARTNNANYPSAGGLSYSNTGGYTLVATKLSPSGAILWSGTIAAPSTVIANGNPFIPHHAEADKDGNIYMLVGIKAEKFVNNVSQLVPFNIATAGSYNPNQPGLTSTLPQYKEDELLLMKLSPSGTKLWATWVGGPSYDNAAYSKNTDLALDKEGRPWITFIAELANLPTTTDAYEPAFPPGVNYPVRHYVQQFSTDGSTLLYSTLYGAGQGYEPFATNLEIDTLTNDVYLYTNITDGSEDISPAYLTTDCAQQSWLADNPNESGYISPGIWHFAKLGNQGRTRTWATVFGYRLEARVDMKYHNGRLHIAGEGNAESEWNLLEDATTSGTQQPQGTEWAGLLIAAFDDGLVPAEATVTANTISPATQQACIGGLVETIQGNKVEVSGPEGYNNIVVYQWQEAPTPDGPWTDIPGEVGRNLSPEPRNAGPVYFRRQSFIPETVCNKVYKGVSNVSELVIGVNAAPKAEAGGAKYYTCIGNSITLNGTGSGGNAPYTYEWFIGSDIEPTTTETELTHAPEVTTLYTFKVTDAVGCFGIDQVSVEPVVADANGDKAFCAGTAGVELGIPGVQGTTAVSYAWTPSEGLNCSTCAQPIASPATATEYTLTVSVREKSGEICTMESSATITPVASPGANFAGLDKAVCQGDTVVIGTPAVSGYSYTWAPGTYLVEDDKAQVTYDAGTNVVPVPKKYSVTALKDGCTFVDFMDVYTIYFQVTPRNKNLCEGPIWVSQEAEAGEKNSPLTTFTWEKVSGDAQFEVLATRNNGADAYVRLVPGSGNSVTFRRKSSILGKDCYSFQNTLGVCPGGNGGGGCTAEVRVLGGSGCPLPGGGYKVYAKYVDPIDYKFKWSPSSAFDNDTLPIPTLTAVTSGINISVIATNRWDPTIICVDTLLVNNPALSLPVFAISDKVTCPDVPVSLGGNFVQGYEYLWDNTAGMTSPDINKFEPNPSVNLKTSQRYNVRVTDTETQCFTNATMQVIIPSVSVDAGPDKQACAGAEVTIGAPAPDSTNYTYLWNPSNVPWRPVGAQGQSDPNPTLLFGGTDITMVVTATEPVNGCIARDTVVLSSPTGGVLPTLMDPDAICPGGMVTIGTTAVVGATYSWSPTTGLSCPTCPTTTAAPETTTTYTLTATGCGPSETAQVTVTVLPAPDFTITNKTICPSSPEGIGIGASGNTGSLSNVQSYSWAPADFLSCSDCANPNASPSRPTSYTLTVTYTNGCSRSKTVTISPPAAVVANAGRDASICPGESALIGMTSVAGATYSWSPGTGLSSTTSSSPTASPDMTTTYTLTVSSAGCTATDQVLVKVKALPELNITGNTTICRGGETEIGVLSAPNMAYFWSPLAGVESPNSPTTIVKPEVTTKYKLTQVSLVTGCTSSKEVTVEVNEPGFEISAGSPFPIVLCQGNSITMPLSVFPADTNLLYWWENPLLLQTATSQNPVATPAYTTEYKVYVTNPANNCVLTGVVPIQVVPVEDCPLFDFGDAPVVYEKTDDPAKHKKVNGIQIGTYFDSENYPQSAFMGAPATGDDEGSPDDEDGSSGLESLHPRVTMLTVNLSNIKNDTFPVAYLAIWADLDRDSCFEDNERIVEPILKSLEGPSAAQFKWNNINPQGILPFGNTYVRARLTGDLTDGWDTDPSPNGCRNSGEIEDYNVYIYPTLPYPDAKVVAVGEKVSGDLSLNDLLPPGATYLAPVAENGNPTNAMPMVNSDGTFMFMANAAGVYNFTVPVNDGVVTTPIKLTFTVLNPALYNPPVATTDIAITKEGVPVVINTLANDFAGALDKKLVPSSVMITQQPQHGTVSVDTTTGNITYTPNAGYLGPDSYLYKVQDNMPSNPGQSVACQFVQVIDDHSGNSVLAANDQECAIADSKNVGNVLDNDMDPEGNGIYCVPMNVSNADYTFMLNPDGSYMFTPAPGKADAVTISYVIYDANPAIAYDTAMLCFYIKTAIGDYAWDDKDGDGVRDQGELPAAGVKVTLHACAGGQPGQAVDGYNAVTDENGAYFIAIPPVGSYALKFDPSMVGEMNTYKLTIPHVGGPASDLLDSDANPITGFTGCFEITDRSGKTDLDVGIFLDKDSDYVPDCIDPNPNMIDPLGYIYCENTGEILDGGKVTVTGPGNIYMIFDGSNGYYQFLVDAPGTYTMTVTNPARFPGSEICLDNSGAYDQPTSLDTLGSGNIDGDDFLDDKTCESNPFYYQLTLENGDFLFNNNFPMTCVDLGDLPDEYPTLKEDDGPGHFILQNPKVYLGNIVDMEPDGQPEAMAGMMTGGDDGDDSELDDEDGVVFLPAFIPGTLAKVLVKVNNLSDMDAKLVGFADLNNDFDFDDDGEMDSRTIPAGFVGVDTLSYFVPEDAPVGQKVGFRIRLSTSCNKPFVIDSVPIVVDLFEGSLEPGDLQFNRPINSNNPLVCNNQGVGTNQYYDIYPFTVSETGEYVFDAWGNDGDNFAIISEGPFDPDSPCANFVKTGNNDDGSDDPVITVNLTAGVQYYYIFTTNPNNATREYYSVFISGDGDVIVGQDIQSSCSYTFGLTDEVGDGWNGGRMEIRQGSTLIRTLGAGFDNDYFEIDQPLTPNTDYSLVFTQAGEYPDEIGIEIYDQSGNFLYKFYPNPDSVGSTLFTWNTGECLCVEPPAMTPFGSVCNGEIEDYMAIIGAFDYGDLPDSYETLNGGLDRGAMHLIQPGKFLGMGVDAEIDANVDLNGTAGTWTGGDDNSEGSLSYGMVNNGDDEDGVSFISPLIPGYMSTVRVKYTATDTLGLIRTDNTYLSAWIDFDGNGIFDSLDKAICDLPLETGTNIFRDIDINIPGWANFSGGAARARFRIHCEPGLGASGPAISGEVEDYYIPVGKAGNHAWFDNDLRGDQMTSNDPDNILEETGINGVELVMVWGGPDGDLNTTEDNRVYRTTTAAGALGENQDGIYYFCGLIQGNYTIVPRKYVGVTGLGTDSLLLPEAILATPSRKILTIGNNVDSTDYKDSDATPAVNFYVPDLMASDTASLGTLDENLTGDIPEINGYPDRLTNLGLDFGFIQEPNIELNQKIAGVEFGSECGQFKVIVDLCVQNSGGAENSYGMAVPLQSIQANVPLANQLGGAFLMTMGSPTILNGVGKWECGEAAMPQQLPTINPAFDGRNDTRLFTDSTGLLYPGEKVVVRYVFEVNPYALPIEAARNMRIQASGSGKAVNYQGAPIPDYYNNGDQYMAMDLSNDGLDFNGTYTDPDSLTNIGDCWEKSQNLVANNKINLTINKEKDCYTEVEDAMILASYDEECVDRSFCLSGYYRVYLRDLSGNAVPNPVPPGYGGKTIIAEVKNIVSCNSTWGYVYIEDKLGPKLTVPKDTTIYCVESTLPTRTGEATAKDCGSTPKIVYRDVVEDIKCTESGQVIQRIIRTWIASDDKGHLVTGEQIIEVKSLHIDSLRGPETVVEVNCTDGYTPEAIASSQGVSYGYPNYISPVTGLPSAVLRGSSCNFAATYTDLTITEEACKANCKATQNIVRTWTVIDWCTGTVRKYVQLIKRADKTAPEISVTSPGEIYSVNAWDCDVDITLPNALVLDNCDPDAAIVKVEGIINTSPHISEPPTTGSEVLIEVTKQANGRWLARKVPQGVHTFVYTASDCCGNTTSSTITIEVQDRVAPIATAKEFITVSLTRNGDDEVKGVAKVHVDQVDNGSYDNCTKVYMEIRRDDESPACQNFGGTMSDGQPYNNNRTYNADINGLNQNVPEHLQDNGLDTDNGQYVQFCCEDIGKKVKVWLRVWDDANGSGVYGDVVDGIADNYNETWTEVKVEDKSVPNIICKPDVTIDCTRDPGIVTGYNFTTVWENTGDKVPAVLLPVVEGVCGTFEFEFRDAGSVNTCNQGTFTRTYRVKGHPTVTCTMKITIGDVTTNPVLEWPIDVHEWNSCELTEQDVLENTVRANREDSPQSLCEKTGTNAPWCFGLTGTALANCRAQAAGTNGFTPDYGALGTGLRNQVKFNANYKDTGCNVFGRKITIEEYHVGEGCKKWLVKWEYINWCTNTKAGCRETIYKYEDKKAPVIVSCPGVDTDILDGNCRAQFKLSPEARDEGGCDAGLTWRIRIFPGIANPSLAETNNPSLYTEYRTVNGLSTGVELQGVTPTFTHPTGLAAGVYGVVYLVRDGCGNVQECRSTIGIWPKAATPYCVSISSAVMKNGLVELWARDFDKGSFTNCGTRALYFTFNREGKAEHPSVDPAHLTYEHYFTGLGNFLALRTPGGNSEGEAAARALYNEGKAQLWLPDVTIRPRPTLPNGQSQPDERILTGGTSGMQFGCKAGNTTGSPITVEMRVWDSGRFKAGTTHGSDFCSTRLTLTDNQGGCGGGTLVTIGGSIQTESAEMMSGVGVQLKAELPEYPQSTKTDKEGKYAFGPLPTGLEYTIEPSNDTDYRNGLNTLDLVQIQRHILGIEKLDNPYRMIAADADGDKAIRVNDIVTLRKLILGVTDKIDGVPSWRFVDAGDKMESGPWSFREVISHATLTESKLGSNFIGVKVGDVDGTASANAFSQVTEPRNIAVRMSVEDRVVKAGEEVVITLKADKFNEVYGIQLGLRHEGMELVSADGRAIELTEAHMGKVRKDLTTMSWASERPVSVTQGSEVMRLIFRALKSGSVAEMIQLTSEVTNVEAYTGAGMERGGILLEIRRDGQLAGLNLRQNEPNPWRSGTVIRYDLPQAGAVKVTIADITGKIIKAYDTYGNTGENTMTITREQLNGATGVMIYKVESGTHTAQRKMLVIE